MSIRIAILVAIAISSVVAALVFVAIPEKADRASLAQNTSNANGSITIVTISGGSTLFGSTYKVAQVSTTSSTGRLVTDNLQGDADPAVGIIKVANIQNGNYSVSQVEAPSGYSVDATEHNVNINGDSKTLIFSDTVDTSGSASQPSSIPRTITYTAKFECGTISGGEGPLRPGHYDTDISILNKQNFQVKVMWSASIPNKSNGNITVQNLEPKQSTTVVCKDLRPLINSSSNFTEGFVFIETPLDSNSLGAASSNGAMIINTAGKSIDLLDVQVFYTANALDNLPHEVYVDKISFTIINDTSGKIPKDMLGKILDVTVPSSLNTVSDPEKQVKDILSQQYGLSDREQLAVRINSVGVSVSAMIDDHAISLSHVLPQARN